MTIGTRVGSIFVCTTHPVGGNIDQSEEPLVYAHLESVGHCRRLAAVAAAHLRLVCKQNYQLAVVEALTATTCTQPVCCSNLDMRKCRAVAQYNDLQGPQLGSLFGQTTCAETAQQGTCCMPCGGQFNRTVGSLVTAVQSVS